MGLTGAGGLKMLLQRGFVIADGSAEGFASLEGDVEAGKSRLDDVLFDEGAGDVESAVEIERGDDGFESVGEKGRLFAASALLFARRGEDVSQGRCLQRLRRDDGG